MFLEKNMENYPMGYILPLKFFPCEVKVMGEFKDILIRIASNPKVHHFIDIIVVDIPESCVLLLCRDWS